MQYRLILPLLCCFAGFTQDVHATPVPPIDMSQAVAPPRTDPGTGICGNITHFMQPQMPLTQASDAVMILNLPMGSPSILGRTARIFDNINFRNGQPGSDGDFQPPNYRKDVFPYSIDPNAVPMGDDNNFALRLRGYFNVPATLTGKVIDFGLNCDDFCSLTIGTTSVIPVADERISARVIRQVTFKDPGLYPIELIYYQNGTNAFLEWSHTTTAVPECPNDICGTPLTGTMYMGAFNLVARAELYSSIVGANPGCQECGATGMPPCPTGNYCGNGLCQACGTPDHCGASCIQCPQNRYICSAGQCVQCVADSQCPVGDTCDTMTGNCVPPAPCTKNTDCRMDQVCNPDTNLCGMPPTPCTNNDPGMCPPGLTCIAGLCQAPAKMCTSDADCASTQYCDLASHTCKARLNDLYVGGQAGCTMSSTPGQDTTGTATGMLALCGLALLGLGLHRRRRLVFQTAST